MTVELDGEELTVEDVVAVAREDEPVRVSEDARERVCASRRRVEAILEGEETVYGVNTGFGELVDERIPATDLERLQTNLLRSHAAGAGRELTREEVRAMMVSRINALIKGYSGIREVVIEHLVAMLNEGVHPVVRSRGSLGASGDLAPLAHMALVLIGEGEAHVDESLLDGSSGTGDDGRDSTGSDHGDRSPHDTVAVRRLPGAAALEALGLEALTLAPKEGLALINGTQLTVGLAALLVHDASRTARMADVAGALTTEVTMATTATADPAIHDVRPHAGQRASARRIRRLTADSAVVESHRNCDRVQDAYSLRCLAQVHGAVHDAIAHLREAVEIELNSATDNPLVFDAEAVDGPASGTDEAAVLSGGNFHGAPLAHRLEYAAGALADLAAIAERRIDRILNPNLQEQHLPAFLAPASGVQSGYMIAQYTAAALLNEARSVGRPALDNVPVSGGQEDHVSMSAQSAMNARRVHENVRRVIATEIVCAAGAADYIGDALAMETQERSKAGRHVNDDPSTEESGLHGADCTELADVDPEAALGRGTGRAYRLVRSIVDPLEEDRPIHVDVDRIEALLESGAFERELGDLLE